MESTQTESTEPITLAGLSTIPRVSEKAAAKALGAKPQTMRAWRHRGVGPAYLKLAGKIMYRLDDLKKFIEQSRIVPKKRAKQAKSLRRKRLPASSSK
jgi:hypothetical protein